MLHSNSTANFPEFSFHAASSQEDHLLFVFVEQRKEDCFLSKHDYCSSFVAYEGTETVADVF